MVFISIFEEMLFQNSSEQNVCSVIFVFFWHFLWNFPNWKMNIVQKKVDLHVASVDHIVQILQRDIL